MLFYFRSTLHLLLVAVMVAALGACSSSSSPTADDGISSLKGIEGAFDESGDSGIHPDTWEDEHQAQADIGSCVSCHADTAVDDPGCLPCHTGEGNEEEDEEDHRNPHPESWEDDHRAETDFNSCIACHSDTVVDDQGCLPCHTGDEEEDDEEEDDEEEEEEEED